MPLVPGLIYMAFQAQKKPCGYHMAQFIKLAGLTGLEPAASSVTG